MKQLDFDTAIRIAKGCLDYKGGYDGAEYEAFQQGIHTVIAALKSARDNWDSQVAALYIIGGESNETKV
jgi:hypothetical protein